MRNGRDCEAAFCVLDKEGGFVGVLMGGEGRGGWVKESIERDGV